MRKPMSEKQLQAAVDAFNANFPVGTTVRVWKGVMGDGPGLVTEIVEPGAFILGGHTAVAKIPGDAIALSHIVREAPQDRPIFTLTPITLPALQAWLAGLPWPLATWATGVGVDTIICLVPEDRVDLKRKTAPHPGDDLVVAQIHLPDVPAGHRLLSGDDMHSNRTPLIHALQNALAAHCCGFSIGFSANGASLWNHGCSGLINRPLGEDVDVRRAAYAEAVRPLIEETAQRYGKGWRYTWPKAA